MTDFSPALQSQAMLLLGRIKHILFILLICCRGIICLMVIVTLVSEFVSCLKKE